MQKSVVHSKVTSHQDALQRRRKKLGRGIKQKEGKGNTQKDRSGCLQEMTSDGGIIKSRVKKEKAQAFISCVIGLEIGLYLKGKLLLPYPSFIYCLYRHISHLFHSLPFTLVS